LQYFGAPAVASARKI